MCHNPETFSFQKEIALYQKKCIGCGSCTDECTCGAITTDSFDRNKCILCGKCADACPTNAKSVCGTEYDPRELADKILEDREFFENGEGGVTLSGGECLAQIDFAIELAKIFYKKGISVDVDTCGYVKKEII